MPRSSIEKCARQSLLLMQWKSFDWSLVTRRWNQSLACRKQKQLVAWSIWVLLQKSRSLKFHLKAIHLRRLWRFKNLHGRWKMLGFWAFMFSAHSYIRGQGSITISSCTSFTVNINIIE